ncbi:MAG: adenylate/guanylate cyclase domain-containing protein [Actinobacteria bacterium]|nr:adenylate/guanylate cyclase domain-containing protein [Actinomycetota bacterium]
MDAPEVRYARSRDVNVAYAVMGDGPFDLVLVGGWVVSNLEWAWDGPAADFFTSLARFSRLILFDKRGTGLSDRMQGVADLETRMDDVRAVMDACGSERAAVMGISEGGPMTALFAATYPQRVAAAVLYASRTCYRRTDDYPWGSTPEEWATAIERVEWRWRTDEALDETLEELAPTLAHDPHTRRWWRRWLRTSVTPGAVAQYYSLYPGIDVRHILPSVRVPTLILHRRDDQAIAFDESRYAAARIPGAEFIELPGPDHAWFVDPEQITAPVERFLHELWHRGEWDAVETERVLATVLFTDIVGSTTRAAELGDRRWREELERHHALVRRQLLRYGGRELDMAGDGIFASFDGPARAIRCARAIVGAVGELGLDIRAGLHTGECEVVDEKMAGIAVHIGARVAAAAAPGEVLVSSTVKDLVAGSGITFGDRGAAELKGIPGQWRLYAVESA